MNDAVYKKSFELFLRRTNEKAVITRFIKENIVLHKGMDFLDIGGGAGSLASVISKMVRTILVVEPNDGFYKQLLKQKKFNVLNARWEDARLSSDFDFILAAYVVTSFPQTERRRLIKKMYDLLRPGGQLLILSVDAKKGSWRRIHTYFYKLMRHTRTSSDDELKRIMRSYEAASTSFKTSVITKGAEEMLRVLSFDFSRYPEAFWAFRGHLKRFLGKYSDKSGRVTLEIVHNAYIITKP